mmetsp:Transcript_2444/g.7118  ORF Transcript_2444/g.7118 Transcript_2444/m.7118 type:complete len:297 (-) Transcript_2444:603-1493(-)
MDLHNGDESSIEIVRLWLLGVKDFHRKCTARNGKDGAMEEVGAKLLGIERRTCYNDLHVRSAATQVLEQTEKDIGVDCPLVRLIQHERRIPPKVVVSKIFSHQHTIGHVLDYGLFGGNVLETDGISDLFTQRTAKLLGDTFGDGNGGHPSWLRTTNDAVLSNAHLRHVLRHLGRFTGTSFTNHNQNLILGDGAHELGLEAVDREAFALVLDGLVGNNAIGQRLGLGLLLPFRCTIERTHVDTAQLLRKVSLAGLGKRILPRAVEILGNGIDELVGLRLAQLPSLFGKGRLLHGRTL